MEHQIIPWGHRRQQTGLDFTPFLLGKDVSGLAQRPGHHGLHLRRGAEIAAIRRQSGDMVIAAVHRRAHQVVKAGVNQHEVAAAHLFHAAHLRHQHAGLGHQEASGLNLQFHRVPQMGGDLLPGAVPQAVIVGGVDGLFTLTVRNRQAAAGGDGLQILAKVDNLAHHRAAHLLQVTIVDARADMHMDPHQLQLITTHHFQRRRQMAVPDAMLAVLTAGIGFLAVAVAKARVDAQPDAMARRHLAQLAQHVDRAGVHRDL